jgi:hypothetical protein
MTGVEPRFGFQASASYRIPLSRKSGLILGVQYNVSKHEFANELTVTELNHAFPDALCSYIGYETNYYGVVQMNLHLVHVPVRYDVRFDSSFHVAVGASAGRNFDADIPWVYSKTGTDADHNGCAVPVNSSRREYWHMNVFYTEASVTAGYGFRLNNAKRLWLNATVARSFSSFEDISPKFGLNTAALILTYGL